MRTEYIVTVAIWIDTKEPDTYPQFVFDTEEAAFACVKELKEKNIWKGGSVYKRECLLFE